MATLELERKHYHPQPVSKTRNHKIHRSVGYAYAINSFAHSQIPVESYSHVRPSISNSLYLHNTKNVIILLKNFKQQCAIHENFNFSELQSEFVNVVSQLVLLPITDISFSLTLETSAFFIFKKNNYEFHLNYFFEDENDDLDDDKAVLISYDENTKLPSISGEFPHVIKELKYLLNLEAPAVVWIY